MRRRGLLWQLYVTYLAVILVSLAVVTGYAAAALRRAYLDQAKTELAERAALLADQLTDAYHQQGPAQLDRLVKSLAAERRTRITVILPDGLVVADSEEEPSRMENHADRPEIVQALKGRTGSDTRISPTLNIRMVYTAIPLTDEGRTWAVLRTAIPLASLDQALRGLYRRILLTGLVVAVLAAIVSLAVSRRITQPLEQIRRAAERFARGDLAHKVPAFDTEEFGALAEAMNQMARDLDERIRTTVAQRNEQQAILSSMVEGVLAVDTELRVISVNDAARDLLGIRDGRPEQRMLRQLVRQDELASFVEQVLECTGPADGRFVLGDGVHERHVQTRGAALRDAAGHRFGAVVVLHDVTALHRLENIRRDFVANVSHELKTPITSIKGFIETLLDGAVDDPANARRFLEIVARQAGRLNAIVEDLLTLSRIEQQTEEARVELQDAPLWPTIAAAVQLCEIKAADKQITVRVDCPPAIRGRINPPLLEQAVVNLVDNAIKYSDPGNEVHVKVEASAAGIEIRVIDHGCGIESRYLPRLFERFYRVDKARSRKLGGTGLGLAIVKHIAQAHGGRATVQSTPGHGSTFTIHLPAAPPLGSAGSRA